MNAVKSFLFLSLFVFTPFDDVDCDCILSLRKDFGKPSPVLLHKNTYLAPDNTGVVTLKRSEPVTVACPGSKQLIVLGNTTSGYDVLEAVCLKGTLFRVESWTGEFQEIRCSANPVFMTQESAKPCYRPKHGVDNAKRYRVGYQVKSLFYPIYEACFDATLLRTRYVLHTLAPHNRYMQKDSVRPLFTDGGLFGKVKISNIYRKDHQTQRLEAILGPNMAEKYITKSQFLNRGHLAPRADFCLHAESRASFHYVNAAPQWQRGNAGDWAALEDALRRRVHSLGYPVSVWTGTHRTVTLPDAAQHPREIFLHTDENNNQILPVPLYFYKLVYDKKEKRATAFVTINSSFYNDSTIQELTFCDDVCDGRSAFSWLKWRSNDDTFSFCCNYEQFTKEIDYFNKLKVVGLFY